MITPGSSGEVLMELMEILLQGNGILKRSTYRYSQVIFMVRGGKMLAQMYKTDESYFVAHTGGVAME